MIKIADIHENMMTELSVQETIDIRGGITIQDVGTVVGGAVGGVFGGLGGIGIGAEIGGAVGGALDDLWDWLF